jgi:hypothetical protein
MQGCPYNPSAGKSSRELLLPGAGIFSVHEKGGNIATPGGGQQVTEMVELPLHNGAGWFFTCLSKLANSDSDINKIRYRIEISKIMRKNYVPSSSSLTYFRTEQNYFKQGFSSLSRAEISSLADILIQLSLTIPDPSDIRSKKDKRRTVFSTWNHIRLPQNGEPEFKEKTRIFYCKYCQNPSYGCQNSFLFRNHLTKNHNIDIQPQDRQIQISTLFKLQDLYDKAASSN